MGPSKSQSTRWVMVGPGDAGGPIPNDILQSHSRCAWLGALGAVRGAWSCCTPGAGAQSAMMTGDCRTRRWSAGSWAVGLRWLPHQGPGSGKAPAPFGSTTCGAAAMSSALPSAGTGGGTTMSAPTRRMPALCAQLIPCCRLEPRSPLALLAAPQRTPHTHCVWLGALGAARDVWSCCTLGVGARSVMMAGGCRMPLWSAGSWAVEMRWLHPVGRFLVRALAPSGWTMCGAGGTSRHCCSVQLHHWASPTATTGRMHLSFVQMS